MSSYPAGYALSYVLTLSPHGGVNSVHKDPLAPPPLCVP